VIDTYGSFAFGFVHTTKQPEAAVAVVHNDVLPFYLWGARVTRQGDPHRYREGVLRNGATSVRAVPGTKRHRASSDEGAKSADERFCWTIQSYGARWVLQGGVSEEILRTCCITPNGSGYLAPWVQLWTAAPWVPQSRAASLGDYCNVPGWNVKVV